MLVLPVEFPELIVHKRARRAFQAYISCSISSKRILKFEGEETKIPSAICFYIKNADFLPWNCALNPLRRWLLSDVKWSRNQFLLLITGEGRFMPVSLEREREKISLVNQQSKCPLANPLLKLTTDSHYFEIWGQRSLISCTETSKWLGQLHVRPHIALYLPLMEWRLSPTLDVLILLY